jgi:plasmid stabilization system protein ParE
MKKYKVIFSSYALSDIEEVVLYYNTQQKGLGKRFAIQLQLPLKSIKSNPHFTSVHYDDVRCAQVPKFPYLVHYTIDEDTRTVLITAVYSTHQQPLGQ